MKLYIRQGACYLEAHIAGGELGLPIDVHSVAKPTYLTSDGLNFEDMNGLGHVPALTQDAGTTLVLEAEVILQYRADQNPAAGLLSAVGTRARLDAQSMLNGRMAA